MCKCLFVEYTCCCKSGCPHDNPQHQAYHGADHIFQTDHFKWNHCTTFLVHAGITFSNSDESMHNILSLDEQPTAAKTASLTCSLRKDSVDEPRKASPDGSPTSFFSQGYNNSSTTTRTAVLQMPSRVSGDPRHGGKIPGCGKIEYEGWRIQSRCCRWCEDYWIGRSEAI